MLNQHSLEEIGDIHNLLQDIKKEYEEGIKPKRQLKCSLLIPDFVTKEFVKMIYIVHCGI